VVFWFTPNSLSQTCKLYMRDLYHGFSDTVYRISFWTFIPTNTTFLHKYSTCNRKLNSIIHLVAYKFSPSKEGGGGRISLEGAMFPRKYVSPTGGGQIYGGGGISWDTGLLAKTLDITLATSTLWRLTISGPNITRAVFSL
jgi:phosphoribosyl 1,2-cyclic phosphodiesterase